MDAGNPRGGNRPGVEAALQARGASPAIQIERPSSDWAFVLIFQHSKFTLVEILSHLLAAHPGLEAPGPPGRGESSTGMSLECLLPAPFPPQAINRCLLEIRCRPGSHALALGADVGNIPSKYPTPGLSTADILAARLARCIRRPDKLSPQYLEHVPCELQPELPLESPIPSPPHPTRR